MAKLSQAWLSAKVQSVKIVTLALCLYLFSPILILSLLLLQTVRKCVTLVAKIYDKKLHKIISPDSALLAADDLYGIPSNNIVALFVLNGSVSVQNLRSLIYENVINKKGASGQLIYPQLQQFPVRFCKFMFWRWDEDFDISVHARLHRNMIDDNKSWNEAYVLQLQNNLLRKQWMRKQSLWEVVLVPNYKDSPSTREIKTVMLIRFHESLGDLSYWFRLFLTNLCDCDNEQGHLFPNHHQHHSKSSVTSEASNVGIEVWKYIYQTFISPLRIPFHFVQQVMDTDNDKHCWSVEEKMLMKRDHFKIIDKFSVQHIKDIKCILGVSFVSVILAATAAAIRITLLSLGHTLPNYISIEFPIMEGCHCDIDDMLGGYRSSCCIKLPVGISSSKERLRLCHESYAKVKQSQVARFNRSIRRVLGLFPIACFKPIRRNLPWSGTLLNLPSTENYVSIMETPIEDIVVASARESGFAITFLSYAGTIRMSLVIDNRLIPANREDVAKDLLKNFYSELVVLGIETVV